MLSVTSARPKPRQPRPTYDELADEVARLRDILEPKGFTWVSRIGVSPTQARILWLLVNREIVTHDAVSSALLHDRRDDEPDEWVRLTRAHVSYLRRKLRKRFGSARPIIKNVFGVGYEMDAEYRAILRKEILGTGQT